MVGRQHAGTPPPPGASSSASSLRAHGPSAASSSASAASLAGPHMYLLEGGLLVVANLLKTDAWVHDGERSHCNVCVQQFMPFRRRHHCRTCGEVVCGSCSSQRKIHLTEVNVECATRVCTFCMIRATDASISANESALRETISQHQRHQQQRASLVHGHARRPIATTASGTTATMHGPGRPPRAPPASAMPAATTAPPPTPPQPLTLPPSVMSRVSKQYSMLSLESELTDGSVVQLWPNPHADKELARLEIARNSTIRTAESDPTMTLLVSIVARTLECPVAFIGILDDHHLWFKATVGWDRTHIARDDCVCALEERTVIAPDTNVDKHFHANTVMLGDRPMRYYAGAPIRVLGQCIGAVSAIDTVPHWETTASMRSTLEAVANIVSEVLEQRVDGGSSSTHSQHDGGRLSETPLPPLPLVARASLLAAVGGPEVAAKRTTTTTTAAGHAAPGHARAMMTTTTMTTTTMMKTANAAHGRQSARPTQSRSSCETESTLVDAGDAYRDLQAIEGSLSSLDSDEDEFDDFDDDQVEHELATPAPLRVHPWPPTHATTGPGVGGESTTGYGPTTGFHRLSGPFPPPPNVSKPPAASNQSTTTHMHTPPPPRYSLAAATGPPEVADRIAKAMEFFQGLQSSRWAPCEMDGYVDPDIRAFELMNQGRVFTKSHATLLGDCTHVIAQLQMYSDPRVYTDIFAQVLGRQKLHVQTWIDSVRLQPGFDTSYEHEVRVLSHWRQYPDGSNVIVAFNDTNPELLMLEDFLFGWFVAPGSAGQHGNCVNVSCIIAQPYENQHADLNLSHALIQRLQQTLPFHYELTSAHSERSLDSADNQRGDDHGISTSPSSVSTMSIDASGTPIGRRQRCSSSSTVTSSSANGGAIVSGNGGGMVALRSKYTEVSNLNDNERMMLDLLDKTISTQEVLAAQQHVMANVMDYHGAQLKRISHAIDRVETILSTNGDKLKQLNTAQGRPTRHSISS